MWEWELSCLSQKAVWLITNFPKLTKSPNVELHNWQIPNLWRYDRVSHDHWCGSHFTNWNISLRFNFNILLCWSTNKWVEFWRTHIGTHVVMRRTDVNMIWGFPTGSCFAGIDAAVFCKSMKRRTLRFIWSSFIGRRPKKAACRIRAITGRLARGYRRCRRG